MKKLLAFLLPVLFIVLGYFLYSYALPLFQNSSSILITTNSSNAVVTLNEKTVSSSKIEKIKPGDYLVKITGDVKVGEEVKKYRWEGTISVLANSKVVVNRELAPSLVSAGEILSTEPGSDINLISDPEGSSVTFDGKEVDNTPLSTAIASGVHKLTLSKNGYLKRELTINKSENSKLNLSVDLALDLLSGLKLLEEDKTIKVFGLPKPKAFSTEEDWAESVLFSQEKHSSSASKLDIVIDSKGASYSASPKSLEAKFSQFREGKQGAALAILVAYVSKDKMELTDQAKKTLEGIREQMRTEPTSSVKIEILSTPTGFLNVRNSPSASGGLKTQVKPGETFDLLEENPAGWYKIKLKDGEGWVSSQYSRKKSN